MSERKTLWRALSSRVIVVAKQGDRGDDWAAYIDAVPGLSHSSEWLSVAERGTKLPYNVARVLFPSFDEKYEWRS